MRKDMYNIDINGLSDEQVEIIKAIAKMTKAKKIFATRNLNENHWYVEIYYRNKLNRDRGVLMIVKYING